MARQSILDFDRYYFECPKVKTISLGQPDLFDYPSYMERIIEAGQIYTGAWPQLPEEPTAICWDSCSRMSWCRAMW